MRGVYVHIPFCVQKCKYCDFASYTGDYELMHTYTTAVRREAAPYCRMEADTVYIGGGTPTALEIGCLDEILYMARSNFRLADDFEFTVEANPGTVTEEKAELLRRYGVNRISLGAQSFIDSELTTLGRIHTADDTAATFEMLRSYGFDNISLDLMYALPGQTMETLSKSVDRVLSLKPEHISCYGLKIEEGTPFCNMLHRGEIAEKDEDEYADMYEYIVSSLANNGYERYELSNFARNGRISRHNTKYWTGEEYLGLGLGASSYIDGRRFTKCSDFESYFKGFSLEEDVVLTEEEKMSEFVILGLRMVQKGISLSEFKARFGREFYDVFGTQTDKFAKMNMLKVCGDRIKLTDKATYVCNSILCEFV